MKRKSIIALMGLVLLLMIGITSNVYANWGEPPTGSVKSGPAIVGKLTLDILDIAINENETAWITFTVRIEGCCADCYTGGMKCSANIKHTLSNPLGAYINDTSGDKKYNFKDVQAIDLIGWIIPENKVNPQTPRQCYSREGGEAMEISDAFDIQRSVDGMHMTANVVLLYWVVK